MRPGETDAAYHGGVERAGKKAFDVGGMVNPLQVFTRGKRGGLEAVCAVGGEQLTSEPVLAHRELVSRWKLDLVVIAVEETTHGE